MSFFNLNRDVKKTEFDNILNFFYAFNDCVCITADMLHVEKYIQICCMVTSCHLGKKGTKGKCNEINTSYCTIDKEQTNKQKKKL